MTTKTNKTNTTPAASLDWTQETARMEAAAKEKGGSRGDALAKVAKAITADTPAAALMRKAAGDAGAQAFIEQPRNVLAKLQPLADCISGKRPWCDAKDLDKANARQKDASVAVALVGLGAGTERQKSVVASAINRYPGGANAQMPAALEALAFFGIVKRLPGGQRNAEYVVADEKRAALLIPSA